MFPAVPAVRRSRGGHYFSMLYVFTWCVGLCVVRSTYHTVQSYIQACPDGRAGACIERERRLLERFREETRGAGDRGDTQGGIQEALGSASSDTRPQIQCLTQVKPPRCAGDLSENNGANGGDGNLSIMVMRLRSPGNTHTRPY